jgi:hypothetical protein
MTQQIYSGSPPYTDGRPANRFCFHPPRRDLAPMLLRKHRDRPPRSGFLARTRCGGSLHIRGNRSHEGRRRQATQRFGIGCLQCIRNAQKQDTGLLVLSLHLYPKPAGFPRRKKIGGQALASGRTQHDGVMASLVRLHVLGLHPQWCTALLILVKTESHARAFNHGFALDVSQYAAEVHQWRNDQGMTRVCCHVLLSLAE